MADPAIKNNTRLLTSLSAGSTTAANELFDVVYAELRAMAGRCFRSQQADHTLQATALVHEAYLKMVDQTQAGWNDRAHFLAVAATAMRQILINHARDRRALKRGGDRRPLSLEDTPAPQIEVDDRLLALHEALEQLTELDARKARVVEARFFGGLTMEEIAQVLEVSLSTVESDWRMARAWLTGHLDEQTDS